MANFTTIQLDCNTGTNASPTWTAIAAGGSAGANEVRWSSTGTGLLSTGNAAWPADNRPASTQQILYCYAFTADTTGLGFIGTASNPASWVISNYHWSRWDWDSVGTFAAAPIWTFYKSTSHDSASRNDGSILGGSTDTTNTNAYSYIKANLYGQVTATAAPTAQPSNAPLVTSGTAGSVSPVAGANWMTNFQSMNGDTDYITFAATPAATTAGTIEGMFVLFDGPTMTPSTYTPVCSLKYSWT